MTPGDIHWVQLPPAYGQEPVARSGRHLAVILQDDTVVGQLPLVIVVPLTGAVDASRFPGTLLLDPSPENGLQRPSVALVFQIRAVDRQRVQDKTGTVGPHALAQIHTLLDQLMGRVTSG